MEDRLVFRKIDSPESLQESYRLRFQVYCKECNFIEESQYPGGYESDDYDRDSLHFGALGNDGRLIGAVRLILPSCAKFPIQERCPSFNFDDLNISRMECAEISRLTISKSWRQQIDARPTNFILQVSYIALGLCHQMYRECRALGIDHCLALMEKPLWMLLKMHGFLFSPIGPEIDYFGKVTPYLIDIRDLEKKGLFKVPYGREIRIQEDRFA
ncbi:MAG: PEP-CTERM/exosortase system-associated acyltransferase [Candidatus Omnitrophica bacterium]|nr:PEP-CTERM/exosortase system-associated acyltransferase [Candidatus Omnitrophota bacterium]